MAKSTKGGGPSFSDDELQDPQPPEVMLRNPPTVDRGDAVPVRFQIGTMTEVGGERTSVGNSSDQSSSDESSSSKRATRNRQEPAQTMVNRSGQSPEEVEDSAASLTDGSGQETDQESTEDDLIPWADESWSYRDLQLECKERNLSASGSQAELVARLEEYDAEDE
jgi:hypothetical protein